MLSPQKSWYQTSYYNDCDVSREQCARPMSFVTWFVPDSRVGLHARHCCKPGEALKQVSSRLLGKQEEEMLAIFSAFLNGIRETRDSLVSTLERACLASQING